MPSAAAMIMLYYKLKDNIADEKGFKKLSYYLLLPIFSGAHKKAAKKFPKIENIVAEYISSQNELVTQLQADVAELRKALQSDALEPRRGDKKAEPKNSPKGV